MDAILYSTLAGISTVLGVVVVYIFGRPKQKMLSTLLGFAGGVMLAISLFELLPEAIEFGSVSHLVIGLALGGAVMFLLDNFVPHHHFTKGSEDGSVLRLGYLVTLGIALHNLPEGFAIGAGLEANPALSLYIAISIGLHNIPEGIATTAPLSGGGLSWLKIALLNLGAGMMTPVGTILGLLFFNLSPGLVGMGLAFAAGAMIYIVLDELLPESYKYSLSFGNAGLVTGIFLGYLLFMA